MQGNTLKEGIMGAWTTVVGTGMCSCFQTCFKIKKRESFPIVKNSRMCSISSWFILPLKVSLSWRLTWATLRHKHSVKVVDLKGGKKKPNRLCFRILISWQPSNDYITGASWLVQMRQDPKRQWGMESEEHYHQRGKMWPSFTQLVYSASDGAWGNTAE